MRHVLELLDWTDDELDELLKRAARLKKAHASRKDKPTLQGRVLGLIFEKPSLRTRVSFEAAMAQAGGSSFFMSGSEAALGQRETIADFARTLSQYADAVVLRTFKHQTVEEFARWSQCPVINGLSDLYHPCQALGDMLTIREIFPNPTTKTVVFIGDGNNVARSLAIVCGKLGVRFILSAPKGYGFDPNFLRNVYAQACPEGSLKSEPDPRKAIAQADVVYTDVWTSMGQEDEAAERQQRFEPYQIDSNLWRLARKDVRLLHCLPAHRGEEVTEDVLEGPQSVVFQQAGNRLYAQKALLEWLLLENP